MQEPLISKLKQSLVTADYKHFLIQQKINWRYLVIIE